MALIRDLSKAQLAFQIDGRDIDEFSVIRFRGTEGLCQLYRFEIDLASTQEGTLLDPLIGKPAVLTVNTASGERWFHGIISRFEMSGESPAQTYFRAELVPEVWLLTHRYSSRIFQNKNVKEIITEVLTQGGIPADRFNLDRLTADYESREYCVQYRETDYNFISRLAEEEAIWWYFEQSQDKHVLLFAEKKEDYAPIAGDANLLYRPPTGLNIEEEHVYRFRIAQSVRPGAVVLQDFNFQNPKLDLKSQADNGRDPGLVFSDFPGEYTTQDRGATLAQHRAQEFEASRIVALGQAYSRRLAPGRTFNLTEHPSAGFDGSYLVTRITHQGKQSTLHTTTGGNGRTSLLDPGTLQSIVAARTHEVPAIRELAAALLQVAARFTAGDPTANRALTQWLYHAGQVSRDLPATAAASGGNPLEWLSIPNLIADLAATSVVDFDAPVYDCHFECIPAGTEYVPPRVTPWPVMRGAQTARVVGPENEEIQVDEYGRVKVQFHWDLQGFEAGEPKLHGADSSCWIPVCRGFAGGQYGILFTPRVGQEVVVDFLEGNPNKPMIVGSVFNADHMPPYKLPDEKTKSVIKTHSSKGGGGCNEIRFEDLKDSEQLFIQAQRRMDTRVKASHYHTIGGSYHIRVGGEYQGELKGDLRELIHKDKHVHIKEHLFTWVEQEEHRQIGGLQAVEIGGTRSWLMHDDAIDLFEANHQHEVTGTYYLTADSIKCEATSGIELVCGGSSIVLTPGGIWINAPMVYINSGAGAPVPPTAVAGLCPGAAEDAAAADKSEPGRDTRYSGPGLAPPELPPLPEVPGHDFPDEPPPETLTSWIEIELVDEEDRPVPGERWEITTPDGKIRRGVTDSNGRARVASIPPGECQIRFPRLDLEAWERIA